MSAALIAALEESRDYVRLCHKATAWHNDPEAYRMITKVIDPALKEARAAIRNEGTAKKSADPTYSMSPQENQP